MSFKAKIWDLPTRLFHWTLLCLMIFLWYSTEIADDLMEWHIRAGKLMLALLLFRVIWGFCGSQTSLFKDFIRSPKAIFHYLFNANSEKPEVIGHNPAGAYMVIVMLIALFVQVISGLFNTDDVLYEGSFYQYASEETASLMSWLHDLNFDILLGLICLHILAILFYFKKGDNLVLPMISGKKQFKKEITPPKRRHPFWALLIFIICSAGVFFGLE